ncbi:AAA family ATPase [Kineosporia sp. NBRC 101731]|uniref:HelD family protein n=1 Tax=Kineosporia sp. NBRC 101731 TaxID=3032199 RepID=UPI002554D67D|nr:AAA family ATPase [Kineosporia sp. NBRC 101731]
MPGENDVVLKAEQEYLAVARGHLARMRENVLSLEAHGVDGTHSRLLASVLRRRAELLLDDPQTPLFFGRIDTASGEHWYVGRRHVADEDGDPVVVDWRADVSLGFYRAGRREPLGIDRRRRFGLDGGRITGFEDEWLGRQATAGFHSALLEKEIERPRVGPMRDIVSTIQPEQDEIVRSAGDVTVCVQGAPGTGKTAVGLHRAAWLLYTYRERLSRSGVLVVGPNSAFLDHISAVLPSLGELQVRQTTIERLTASVPVRGVEPVARAVLKGDARMAEVLRRAVWSHVGRATEALILPRGSRRWRLPASQINEIVAELTCRGVRYGSARHMLPHRLAHALLALMEEAGEAPDDRVQDAVARSREVRRCADTVWPALVPRKVLHQLLSDPTARAEWAGGVLTGAELDTLGWEKPPRSAGSARWSLADSVLLDEIEGLIERLPSLGHVVVDEAQDLSPMQLRAVGRRCENGSATVLGDIAQGTTAWATSSWQESLSHLGHGDGHIEELTRGFRVPSSVIDFAARLLPLIAPGLTAPESVRDDPGGLDLLAVLDGSQVWAETVAALRRVGERAGSVGLIVADDQLDAAEIALAGLSQAFVTLGPGRNSAGSPEPGPVGGDDPEQDALQALEALAAESPRLSLVPASVAKGLEFDHVIVVEPAGIAEAEPDLRTGLRRLYVVLTRAVSTLTVVHHRPLPEALQG